MSVENTKANENELGWVDSTEKCPNCGSFATANIYYEDPFSVLEYDYWICDKCNWRWHSKSQEEQDNG